MATRSAKTYRSMRCPWVHAAILGASLSLLTSIPAAAQPIHLDRRVTPTAAELIVRLDTPRYILFVKRGPGDALRLLWPSPQPDSVPLLESGAWVVVSRPMGSSFRLVGGMSAAECWLVSPHDPLRAQTVTWNAECGLGPAYASGPTVAASTTEADYVEVIAIDIEHPYPVGQMDSAVARLSTRGSRKDFVHHLYQLIPQVSRKIAWAATRVPAIRP